MTSDEKISAIQAMLELNQDPGWFMSQVSTLLGSDSAEKARAAEIVAAESEIAEIHAEGVPGNAVSEGDEPAAQE